MVSERPDTERVALYLTTEAVSLLRRLAPSPKKRGQYISALVKRAAQEVGMIEGPSDLPPEVALAVTRRQFQEVQDRLAALEQEIRQSGPEQQAAES